MTQLGLRRLTHRQGEEIIARLAGGKIVPAAIVDQIPAKRRGVPLFIEELTKTVLDSENLWSR